MSSVGQETRTYFEQLPTRRQLEFLVNCWGARPVFSVDLVEDHKRVRSVAVVVKLVNMIELLELNQPPPVVVVQPFTPKWYFYDHLTAALWAWHVSVYQHQRLQNEAPPKDD